jgi:cytochrome c biogenesis protein
MASSRPSDAIDTAFDQPESVNQPRLGPIGWLRFFWRQLTSMRTALVLLLLLALAAIPGSLVPQVTSDPNGVIQFKRDNPGISPFLDWLGVFSTYSSVWFSAIYLLLFISLIGCVIPRTKHHWDALRARPPKTPVRLERLPGFVERSTSEDAATVVAEAERLLKGRGYRIERYEDSVSAERGYLRETGNLVFHTALIGVLITVGLGGGFGYTGQRVVVEGSAFANVLAGYDSFNPGRFFNESQLAPYSIRLDDLDAVYEQENLNAFGQAIDFTASVTTTELGQEPQPQTIKVNSPLHIGGNEVYLLGNGYAPVLTIRDPDGNVVSEQAVPCRPTDANLTSICVFKVPDGLPEQVGMLGFFYPTVGQLSTGAFTSIYPDLKSPLLTLEIYTGDLGLDDGLPVNVYSLDTDGLTQVAGRDADLPGLQLTPGDKVDLPDGLGSIELSGLPRFAALDIHRDPAQGWVLLFAVLAVAGLLTSLFIPRRRVWVKFVAGKVELAGLARGEDPGLAPAVEDLASALESRLAARKVEA